MKTDLSSINKIVAYHDKFGATVTLTDKTNNSISFAERNGSETAQFSLWFARLSDGGKEKFYRMHYVEEDYISTN